MRLTVGDATIANPIAWDLADVKLEFPAEQAGSTEQTSQGQTNHILNIIIKWLFAYSTPARSDGFS